MKIDEMTKEDIEKHYNWTLDHEEKLKKAYSYLVQKYGVNNPPTEEKDMLLLITIKNHMVEILEIRKILLSRM